MSFIKRTTLIIIIPLFLISCLRDTTLIYSTPEQIDDHPAYLITYKADYNLNKLLQNGASSDREIIRHTNSLLSYQISESEIFHREGKACSGFYSNSQQKKIMGHNEDWQDYPYIVLRTKPENGFESIAVTLIENINNSQELTTAPFYPLTGINSQGLAISTYSVNTNTPPVNPEKKNLIWPTALRLILDKASSVDQALDILSEYNIKTESYDGNCLQFLIGDSKGKSVIVELLDNKLSTIEMNQDWISVTNFSQSLVQEHDYYNCRRYKILQDYFDKNPAIDSEAKCFNLLQKVAETPETAESDETTQFSIYFDLTAPQMKICFGRKFKNIHTFKFSSKTFN